MWPLLGEKRYILSYGSSLRLRAGRRLSVAPVPKRCTGEYTAARVFVDLEIEEDLVVRGLYYDDANDDIILCLYLVNDLTDSMIDKDIM